MMENTTTAQFVHRCLAHTTVFLVCAFWLTTRRAPLPSRARMATNCVAVAALLQLSLGIATLLTLVHQHVAATHQCGSMLLLTTAIWLANELRRIPK
jgi:cytochrome c oxidase assembly protein subunit 15